MELNNNNTIYYTSTRFTGFYLIATQFSWFKSHGYIYGLEKSLVFYEFQGGLGSNPGPKLKKKKAMIFCRNLKKKMDDELSIPC